jgi:hypothetical protein
MRLRPEWRVLRYRALDFPHAAFSNIGYSFNAAVRVGSAEKAGHPNLGVMHLTVRVIRSIRPAAARGEGPI